MAIVINSATGEIDLNATTPGTYVVTYTTNGSCTNTVNNTITINALDGAAFAYSSNSLPQTGTASLTTTPTTSGGVYSAYPSGLSINSSTGEIDLANSTIQSYKIFYETSGAGCPNSSTFDLAVTAAGIANNYSMNFDGVNDYIETSSNVGISGSQSRTISVWLKGGTSNNNKSWPMAVAFGQGSTNKAMWIGGGGGPNSSAYWYFGWWGTDLDSNVRMDADNDWHLLTSTYDGTTAKGYIDGVEVVSGARTINTTDSTLLIGKHLTDSIYWQGLIEEVAIWNTALTSTQVQSIYNATSTNLTKDLTTVSGSNLIYWNRMGD